MLPIQKKLINYNHNKGGNNIKYIVIHDTGNPGASAINHFKYFSGGNRGSSAHYFVDEEEIIQIIEDKDRAWHVGDGKGKYGITNSNSIGVEMCLIGNDIDKEMSNVIDLTVHLMKKHNIDINHVVRHYDASRKSCPNVMRNNNWGKWIEFKSMVESKLKGVDSMTEKQVRDIVRDELNRSKEGISTWAKESWEKSILTKVNDGVGAKNYVTEEQLMVFFDRLGLFN